MYLPTIGGGYLNRQAYVDVSEMDEAAGVFQEGIFAIAVFGEPDLICRIFPGSGESTTRIFGDELRPVTRTQVLAACVSLDRIDKPSLSHNYPLGCCFFSNLNSSNQMP